MNERPQYYHDPGGTKWRAREERLAELMRQGNGHRFESDRHYCELIYDNEEAPFTTDMDQLAATGNSFPQSESLDEPQITAKLAELIDELARMHVYLSFTNHLTDRELYRALVEDALKQERRDIPMSEQAAWHVDLTMFGDDVGLDVDDLDARPAVSDRDGRLPVAG